MRKGKELTPQIGIFGRRNVGKSSLINAIAEQDIAIVSDQAGTTTDPVKKSVELAGYGPVILVDTAGIDDTGELGHKRVDRSMSRIEQVDLGLLLITDNFWGDFEENIVGLFRKNDLPFLVIYNKSDISLPDDGIRKKIHHITGKEPFLFSTFDNSELENLIDLIKATIPEFSLRNPSMLGDIISEGDIVLLITPIDSEAPEGRMILPQVQAIRDVIDNNAVAVVMKETEIKSFLGTTGIKPALAITDSQIFALADSIVPDDVPLTSFSIALARMKGNFNAYLEGTLFISELKDGDCVLLLESCTHQVTCDDIGRNKLPVWISDFTGKELNFDIVSGLETIKKPVEDYSIVIQCGGCMITRKQIQNRLRPAIDAGIPITNYGMAIAYIMGIFRRAIAPFTDNASIINIP